MTPTCAEHRCPTRECEGVVRHSSPCRCGHSQRVHYTWHENCATCDCPEYRNPNALRWVAAAVVVGVLILAAAAVGVWVAVRILRG